MMKSFNANRLSIEQHKERLLCEASFYLFVEKAWPLIEGGNELIPAWHIQAVCEHLEALYKLDISRLIINLPPRMGKSNVCSVLFPAWVWAKSPNQSFLYSSYAQSLSIRDSMKCRRLLQSEWYQRLWGDKVQFAGDMNSKMKFENTKAGYRIASSVDGSNTGFGAHYEICVPYETIIRTNEGDRFIGEIVENKMNVKVLSYNHKEMKTEYQPILDYMVSEAEELIEIKVCLWEYEYTDIFHRILVCTPHHPVFMDRNDEMRRYEYAQYLDEGDSIFMCTSEPRHINNIKELKIKSIEKIIFEHPKKVFNLKVKKNNNYFANGILVHNCDDPNSVMQSDSEVSRNTVNQWHSFTMSSRHAGISAEFRRLVVQQRTHHMDVTGHLLSSDDRWVHLCLPMEFERALQCKTIPLRMSGGKVFKDPRKKEGELLWPKGMNAKQLDDFKKKDFKGDSYRIAGQLQQRPSPEGGGIIKTEWFKHWKEKDYPEFIYILQSWDTALTSSKTSCYSACTTWGVFKDRGGIANIMLLSVFKERIEYPELRKMATRLAHNYQDVIMDDPLNYKMPPNLILIEEKVSGYSLLADLMHANLPVMRFDPTRHGDKIGRCRLVSHLMENGLVWLPTIPPSFELLTEDSNIFFSAAGLFPNDESNDVIDSMSQAFIRLISTGWIWNKEDPVPNYEPAWKTIDKPYT